MALADAAGGVNNAVQQILFQRLQEQRYAQERDDAMKQRAFENARQTKSDERADQTIAFNTQRQEFLDRQNQADKEVGFGNTLNESIPGGTFLEPQSKAVGYLRTAGVPLQTQESRPAIETGPLLPGDTGAAKAQGYIKGASQKQIDTTTDNERQAAAETERNRHDLAMENKPQHDPTPSYQLQPEIDPATGKQTGRFLGYNTKANRWEPVQGQGPQATKAAPGAASAAEKEKSLGNARTTLDRLDADINAAASKGLIGPSAGRISDVEQMIGNNDPAISTLATRMVAAKMLVDAGIGGMRGAASPGLMARWDKLMGMQATPENLHNVAQVMREMVGGQPPATTGGGTVSMVAPDGRALNVPADKVAEMESHGATRK